MAIDSSSLCYIATIVVTIILVIWGFMDILKSKQTGETDTSEVISRQIKGFGFLVLGQLVLIIGIAICLA